MTLELFDNPGRSSMYKYPTMTKTMSTVGESGTKETFILHVEVRTIIVTQDDWSPNIINFVQNNMFLIYLFCSL